MRTVFNILGPLTNPAGAKRQLLGVYRPILTETLANVLLDLGAERALVVHGNGGLDEMSTIGDTKVTEIKDGKIHSYTFKLESVGMSVSTLKDLTGGDADNNAVIIRSILDGNKGPQRDIAVLNAGAALYIAGIVETITDGIKKASDAIDSGLSKKKLQDLIEYSN